jgi:hypothetical protein
LEWVILRNIRSDGFTPGGVKADDGRVFVTDADSPGIFCETGYVFGANGRRIGFASADIQINMPTGKHYIMVYGTRFDLGEIKRCEIARRIVERDRYKAFEARRMILDRQARGKKVGHALQIADRRIKSLAEYLERDAFRHSSVGIALNRPRYGRETIK